MENKSPSINLLRKEEGKFDSFITWSLTVGRIVVILTEAIAFSAFLYRFSLDRQLIDLNDKIKVKQKTLDSLKNDEQTYRNLQQRLATISKIKDQAPEATKTLSEVLTLTPSDLFVTSFNLSPTSMSIKANTPSTDSLAKFIANLKSYKRVASVSIDKIEDKTSSSTIIVLVTAILK